MFSNIWYFSVCQAWKIPSVECSCFEFSRKLNAPRAALMEWIHFRHTYTVLTSIEHFPCVRHQIRLCSPCDYAKQDDERRLKEYSECRKTTLRIIFYFLSFLWLSVILLCNASYALYAQTARRKTFALPLFLFVRPGKASSVSVTRCITMHKRYQHIHNQQLDVLQPMVCVWVCVLCVRLGICVSRCRRLTVAETEIVSILKENITFSDVGVFANVYAQSFRPRLIFAVCVDHWRALGDVRQAATTVARFGVPMTGLQHQGSNGKNVGYILTSTRNAAEA